MSNQKVWFVTGASKGMGLETVNAVLKNGDKVVATSRNLKELIDQIGNQNENFLPLQVDITNNEEVKKAIGTTIETFGKIDVIVNNAGYYLVGSIEEISDEEFRKTIDVNLFGTVNVIRNAMPFLRQQKSGHILNIASNMGYIGYANTGSYNAAKFAVIGLSEALTQEAKPFNIKVTAIAPGMFRTRFMSDSTLAEAKNKIAVYNVEQHVNMLKSFDGNQPGDPTKLAKVLLALTELPNPPVHLPLGNDSYNSIIEQRKNEAQEMETWQHLSFSTNFD
ncbi:NADP-dependent 3-hydroxy acid dehydrogenase YdfG [Flavobacterium resistens]|uniref:NADP-dependent 3-hydroxy acid dehydrogenase YdfG n=1 Tax=Flavobacterium resistens TaxID=443612 RepID=A0A521AN97_9FLAO|nr:SDR family NAD(P)-dependent oxidoreductase [Flavobacterium resistens]MRX69821.1 SDR family NAD(P)-dependent oxidoreductase [Flavobacterium resistens]SMO36299.1 NADP-dependent 3-hydroxy acid dehydrogenase YdfG [Flavobacterium resistens]